MTFDRRKRRPRRIAFVVGGLTAVALGVSLGYMFVSRSNSAGSTSHAAKARRATAVAVAPDESGAGVPQVPDLATTLRIAPNSVRGAGDFVLDSGQAVHLFLGTSIDTGATCLADVGPKMIGQICSKDMFENGPIYVGQSLEDGTLRVVGITQPDVARLEITDGTGARNDVPLNSDHTFVWEDKSFAGSETKAKVISAFDASGKDLGDVAVPIMRTGADASRAAASG